MASICFSSLLVGAEDIFHLIVYVPPEEYESVDDGMAIGGEDYHDKEGLGKPTNSRQLERGPTLSSSSTRVSLLSSSSSSTSHTHWCPGQTHPRPPPPRPPQRLLPPAHFGFKVPSALFEPLNPRDYNLVLFAWLGSEVLTASGGVV